MSKPRWVGGFPTEAAAKRARDEARTAASRGEFVDRSTLTVQDYLNQWLLTHSLEVITNWFEDAQLATCPTCGARCISLGQHNAAAHR